MPDVPATHRPPSSTVEVPRHSDPKRDAERQAKQNQQAYARQDARALRTNSAAWEKLRAFVLRREPLCRMCKKEGNLVEATEVDHIDGRADTMASNRLENLQALCKHHHSSKTAKEQADGNR